MDRLGFIHEKLDIKILILYILRRLPGYVNSSTLADLCQCDGGVGYFDYSDCLYELIDTGNVEENPELGFRITEKGARSVDAVESSLPFSVRKKAEDVLAPVALHLERASMIEASHKRERSGLFVNLSMSDGKGEVVCLRLLVGNEDQAELMEKNFRKNAEKYYLDIIEMLSDEDGKK